MNTYWLYFVKIVPYITSLFRCSPSSHTYMDPRITVYYSVSKCITVQFLPSSCIPTTQIQPHDCASPVKTSPFVVFRYFQQVRLLLVSDGSFLFPICCKIKLCISFMSVAEMKDKGTNHCVTNNSGQKWKTHTLTTVLPKSQSQRWKTHTLNHCVTDTSITEMKDMHWPLVSPWPRSQGWVNQRRWI